MPLELNDNEIDQLIDILTDIPRERRQGYEMPLLHKLVVSAGEHSGLTDERWANATPVLIGSDGDTASNHRDQRTASYCGPFESLRGKLATVWPVVERETNLLTGEVHRVVNYVVAQFNDPNTGYGYGWHRFEKDDFEISAETQQMAELWERA